MGKNKKCPKCNGEMVEGLIATPGGIVGARWMEGIKQKLFVNLRKLPLIHAFKCGKCGYMESYAKE